MRVKDRDEELKGKAKLLEACYSSIRRAAGFFADTIIS
jgi:hypothetical protein